LFCSQKSRSLSYPNFAGLPFKYSISSFCMTLRNISSYFERRVCYHACRYMYVSRHVHVSLIFTVPSGFSIPSDRTEGDENHNLRNYIHNSHRPNFAKQSHRDRALENSRFNPSPQPTGAPTSQPTTGPTPVETDQPTPARTTLPTPTPTARPTAGPTGKPTGEPTDAPTSTPTKLADSGKRLWD